LLGKMGQVFWGKKKKMGLSKLFGDKKEIHTKARIRAVREEERCWRGALGNYIARYDQNGRKGSERKSL